MKFALSWLKDHFETETPPKAMPKWLAGRGLREFHLSPIIGG